MGCCACVQSKKVSPGSPPPQTGSVRQHDGSGSEQDLAPRETSAFFQRPPRAAPSSADRTPRRNSNRASPRPPQADPREPASGVVANGAIRRDRHGDDDVMPGQVMTHEWRPAEVDPPRQQPPVMASQQQAQAPDDEESSSGEFEMPEEQSQAAAAGEDAPAGDAGFSLPMASSRQPYKNNSNFDDDDDESSSDDDDDSEDDQEQSSQSSRTRAAAVLKQLRKKKKARAGSGPSRARDEGARGTDRKLSLKQFDSDEFEPPQEVAEQRVQGPQRSARLVL